MRLKNKKTGEIRELPDGFFCGDNLKKICEEWEDYEEPKDNNYWYIDDFGRIQFSSEVLDEIEKHPNNWLARKLFGNYFETNEEAEKAVEKLKAWKRLKDKGFSFKSWFTRILGGLQINVKFNEYNGISPEDKNDLDLLFGDEE